MFNSTRYKGRVKFREHSLPSTSSPLTLLSHLKSTASQTRMNCSISFETLDLFYHLLDYLDNMYFLSA